MLLRLNTSEQEVWLDMGRAANSVNRELEDEGQEERLNVYALRFPIDVAKADLPGDPSVHLSTTQRRKLRDFDPNVDVAVFFGTLSNDNGDALKALHHYRNRAYHHNDARPETLNGLVEVQLTILANLARSIRPIISGPLSTSKQESLHTHTLGDIASVLNTGVHIHGSQLVKSLQRALSAQLSVLDERLTEIRTFINSPFPLVTDADVLRLVQLPEPWPDISEARLAPVDVTPEILSSWRESIGTIGSLGGSPTTVTQYFLIEKPLTLLMEDILPFTNQIDRVIDRAIDERRGR